MIPAFYIRTGEPFVVKRNIGLLSLKTHSIMGIIVIRSKIYFFGKNVRQASLRDGDLIQL